MIKAFFGLFLSFLALQAQAQVQKDSTKARWSHIDTSSAKTINRFDKKLVFGLTFTNAWTTLSGSGNPKPYFWKPSVGGTASVDYFFKNYIALGIGVSYQQRGTGILNTDYDGSLGNPDSTYRERLRFNCLEFPISLTLRTPKDLIRNIRPSLQISLIPSINNLTTRIFYSVEDGFHETNDLTADHYTSDLLFEAAAGIDVNAAKTGIFRFHFVWNSGTANVYKNPTLYNGWTARNNTIAIRLAWLY
jgi:Outer membrane protein beta-barrel domain